MNNALEIPLAVDALCELSFASILCKCNTPQDVGISFMACFPFHHNLEVGNLYSRKE